MLLGIDRGRPLANLEMYLREFYVAGGARLGDHLIAPDAIAPFHQKPLVVSVRGHPAAGVTQ